MHQEKFCLIKVCNGEHVATDRVIIQEVSTKMDTLEGCRDGMKARMESVARQEHLAAEELPEITNVLSYPYEN